MGGEQAATVLATITKDQRAREGKEVMAPVNQPVGRSARQPSNITSGEFAAKIINIIKGLFLEDPGFDAALKEKIKLHQCQVLW